MSLAILLGPPGALVAECAERISAASGRSCLIVDDVVEAVAGESPERIVTTKGARALRAVEREVVGAILDSIDAADDRILALSSGSLGDGEDDEDFAPVRRRIAELAGEGAVVVHLTGNLATLVKRTGIGGPRLAAVESPRKIFYRHLSRREPLYAAAAEATLDTSGMDVAEAAERVARLLCSTS